MTTRKLILDVSGRDAAHSFAGALENLCEPPPEALTLFEDDGRGAWRIEAYFGELPDPHALSEFLANVTGLEPPRIAVSEVPDLNWVALSQAALPPVHAGRFTIHGSHDIALIPQGPHAILIDAGEAFGTAHHATTYGSLAAIDRVTRRRAFGTVLDLGCGSGVLAIAASRRLPDAIILATDMDATSVAVARANIKANTRPDRIKAFAATGLDHPRLRPPSRFDLVIANILAGPLIALAPSIRTAVAPGGVLILSGILNDQAPSVRASYVAQGFRMNRHDQIAGWSTLTLERHAHRAYSVAT